MVLLSPGTPRSLSRGKGSEHFSPVVKSQSRTAAYPLFSFPLSALHGEDAQLMLVELNLLNCTEGKRGLVGLRAVKSLLQEGPVQAENGVLNLWICLRGPGDVCILNGKQRTDKHIGTAERVVLLVVLLGALRHSV